MNIPIYIFTGLLESGKTTLMKEIAGELLEPGRTLLILTEEGEEEYDEDFLERYDIEIMQIDDVSEINSDFWERCKAKKPAQMVMEYNGMWDMDSLFNSGAPDDIFIYGIYSTVDADTVELYLSNMRKQFLEPLRDSNLVIFNRCDDSHDRLKFRRIVKGLNPPAQIAFEKKDGTMYENIEEVMPFDYSKDVVEIEDIDYGLWYLDAQENPGRYIGKDIVMKARFCASMEPGQRHFVPGRHVMTCCEDDIQFMGYICYYDEPLTFQHGDWVKVRARFDFEFNDIYGEEGPVLHLVDIEPAEAPDIELVTFS